jgi:four helix bundle protein
MTLTFEDLEILKTAEEAADQIWKEILEWDSFARDLVGKQLAEAGDSIGANISEGYGQFHYGEKLHFFYYARGSLFETKYCLNRILARSLMNRSKIEQLANQLTDLARRLNKLAKSTKQQKLGGIKT